MSLRGKFVCTSLRWCPPLFWNLEGPMPSIECVFGPFFGPLAHAPSDVVLDQGNDWGNFPKRCGVLCLFMFSVSFTETATDYSLNFILATTTAIGLTFAQTKPSQCKNTRIVLGETKCHARLAVHGLSPKEGRKQADISLSVITRVGQISFF